MTPREIYADFYAHEKAATAKMLTMLESVPSSARSDPRFVQAVEIAHHIAACRENWIDRIASDGTHQTAWWAHENELQTLSPRFAATEEQWDRFFAESEVLDRDMTFPLSDGRKFCWNVEGHVRSLVGHGNYHRGQVALLVDQLGGVTEDTDYLFWKAPQDPARWGYR